MATYESNKVADVGFSILTKLLAYQMLQLLTFF